MCECVTLSLDRVQRIEKKNTENLRRIDIRAENPNNKRLDILADMWVCHLITN